jgi:MurNAc alpha-1-phosphate uridylyltransferase
MILAAGRGERLRPLTDTVPKPLLEAGGTTLIAWQVARLVAAGWRDLVVNHAHLGALIEQSLGDGARFGATIRYSREAEALESAGGIAQALYGGVPERIKAEAMRFLDEPLRKVVDDFVKRFKCG